MVVWWCELGEMEVECILHTFSLFFIFLPKITEIGGNLTKFWQKEICTVFFWDTVYTPLLALMLCSVVECLGRWTWTCNSTVVSSIPGRRAARTGMDDRLRADKPPQYFTKPPSHPPLVGRELSTGCSAVVLCCCGRGVKAGWLFPCG